MLTRELTLSLMPMDLWIMRNVLLSSKYHRSYSTQSLLANHMPPIDARHLRGGEGEQSVWMRFTPWRTPKRFLWDSNFFLIFDMLL